MARSTLLQPHPQQRSLKPGTEFSSGGIGNRGISDDDDILGILSQPVEVVKAQTQTQVNLIPYLDFLLFVFWNFGVQLI
jgi:hypothetical protein